MSFGLGVNNLRFPTWFGKKAKTIKRPSYFEGRCLWYGCDLLSTENRRLCDYHVKEAERIDAKKVEKHRLSIDKAVDDAWEVNRW